MALTRKKRIFAEAWARGASKAAAAVAAGYSEKTAPQAGSRMAKDPDVVAEVTRLGLPVPAASKAGRKPKKAAPVAPPPASTGGYTGADGVKTADAPADWPFGTTPPPTAAEPPTPSPPLAPPQIYSDPLEYIRHVVNDPIEDSKVRLDAAKAWATYTHAKKAPVGKKAGRDDAAAAAMDGTSDGAPNPFAPRRRLEAVK